MAVFDPIEIGDRGRYDWVGTAILFFIVSLPITFISKTVIERMGLTIEHFIPLLEHPATRISLALFGGLIVWGNIREKTDTSVYVVSKRQYSSAEIDNMVRQAVMAEALARAKTNTPHLASSDDTAFSMNELSPDRLSEILRWNPDEDSNDLENHEDDDDPSDDAEVENDEWEDEWEDEEEEEIASSPHIAPPLTTRLSLELVPRSCWFSNLRSALGQERWKIIAKAVSKNANHRCEVCGGRGPQWPVEAHETWEYDDERGIQRLSMIRALCPSCHEVKHFGLASMRGRKEIAFKHLMTINQWDRTTAETYVHHEFQIWRARSERTWTLDLSELSRFGFTEEEIARLQDIEATRRT